MLILMINSRRTNTIPRIIRNEKCFLWICIMKQKTAYDLRISDWSSEVCSADLRAARRQHAFGKVRGALGDQAQQHAIFTAFLGNPFENLARRLPGADVLRRNVAMRLLADEQIGRAHV